MGTSKGLFSAPLTLHVRPLNLHTFGISITLEWSAAVPTRNSPRSEGQFPNLPGAPHVQYHPSDRRAPNTPSPLLLKSSLRCPVPLQ